MLGLTIIDCELVDLVSPHLQEAAEEMVDRFSEERLEAGDDEVAVARALIFGSAQYLGLMMENIVLKPEEVAELAQLFDIVARAFGPPTMGAIKH